MSITKTVVTWCKAQNKRSGATRWAWGAALLAAVGIILGTQSIPVGTVVFCTAAIGWMALAPRPWQVHALLGHQGGIFVPDSLLGILADAPEIPELAKANIAAILRERGKIAFETLFEIEANISRRADWKRIEQGQGFQKMSGYLAQEITPDRK